MFLDTPRDKEITVATKAALVERGKYLRAELDKTNVYLGETMVHAKDNSARPIFSPKQEMEIEIYAHKLPNKNERESLINLVRGEGVSPSAHAPQSSVLNVIRGFAANIGRAR